MKNELLAPNGKSSNLNAEQYKLVRSEAFVNWFGDWINDPQNASKIIDDNGEPLVVYHGSDNKFNVFDIKKAVKGFHGLGFYFSDRDLEYGKYLYNCFLNLKKPFDINADYSLQEIKNILGNSYFEIKNLIQEELDYSYNGKIGGFIFYSFAGNDNLKKQGYDGLIQSEIYVAFIPNQIKLADGTNKTFNSGNDDIRFEHGGEIDNFKDFYNELKIEDGSKYIGKKFGSVFPFLGKKRLAPNYYRLMVKQYEGVLSRLEKNDYSSKIIKQKDLNKLERIKNNIDKKYFLAKFYLDGTGTIVQFKSNEFSKGGRTIAQTPAPKKDQIKGSDVNKSSSSKNLSSAKLIKFDDKTIVAIKNKVKEHNEENPDKKINLASAKAVMRRGFGAYSKSYRPTISGGKPNSRVAWGLARLNAFTYKIVNGKSKSGKYSQDDDLIEELGFKVANYNNGGEMSKDIRCINCGWEWNRKDSELWDMYVCHKCGFDNTTFYSSIPVNNYSQGGETKKTNPDYLKMFLDL